MTTQITENVLITELQEKINTSEIELEDVLKQIKSGNNSTEMKLKRNELYDKIDDLYRLVPEQEEVVETYDPDPDYSVEDWKKEIGIKTSEESPVVEEEPVEEVIEEPIEISEESPVVERNEKWDNVKFIWIGSKVLQSDKFHSFNERLIFSILLNLNSNGKNIKASDEYFTSLTGLSSRTCRRYLDRFDKIGLIEKKTTKRKLDSGKWQSQRNIVIKGHTFWKASKTGMYINIEDMRKHKLNGEINFFYKRILK